MERLPKTDSQILQYLEPLITAGFLSRRRSIVNISIRFWNDTFGKEETLRFPSRLEQALRQLYNTVELSLPSWEIRADETVSLHNQDFLTKLTRLRTMNPLFMTLILVTRLRSKRRKLPEQENLHSRSPSPSSGLPLDHPQFQVLGVEDNLHARHRRFVCDMITPRSSLSQSFHHPRMISIKSLKFSLNVKVK